MSPPRQRGRSIGEPGRQRPAGARLVLAASAAFVTFLAARIGIGVFLDAYACDTPADWWPDWAWTCGDAGARAARALTTMDWDAVLPLFLALAVFLVIGLTPRRR
ncbi:MAG: hypothetical protein AAGE03_10550 [Pseudomonadota bacterium]